MSGHNRWSKLKRAKAALGLSKGKLYTKLIKELTVAARFGGGDPAGNPRLRVAIAAARGENMPNDSIQRAIKRGTGELEGAHYEEVTYEGYGPGGVALLVECLTDNRNRAAMEVRTAVTRNGGTMADPGSVSRLFTRKGVVLVGKSQERGGKPWEVTEDDVLEATLDAGAEDVNDLGESFEVQSEAGDVVAVRTALQAAGIDYDSAEVQFVATMDIPVGEVEVAGKVFRLVDAVDDLDDVQNVYSNADIPDEVMESIDA